jgi:hypothetical protein
MPHSKFFSIAAAIVVIASTGYVALCRYVPPIPEAWKNIEKGLSRLVVISKLPDSNTDMFDIKLFDEIQHSSSSILYGNINQHLFIEYDTRNPETARVTSLKVLTYTSRFNYFRNYRAIPVMP